MLLKLKKISASLKDKNGYGRVMALTSISGLISNFLTIVSGLLVARWLLPQQLGLFNGFSIVISYIILVQLGIPSGLSRDYPYYLGQSKKERSFELAAVASYWSLLIGIVVLVVTAIISVYFLVVKNYQFAAGVITIGISCFQTFYVTKYLRILFRSNNDFNKLALINISVAVVSFLSIFFVKEFGFYGLCLRTIAIAFFDFGISWKFKPVSITPRWSRIDFVSLLKVGMPIYWVANIFSLWPIVQRTLVVFMGGTKALGLYGLALMVENGMNIISSSIGSVAFPKMSLAWGKTHRFKDLIDIVLKPVMAGFLLNAAVVVAGWFILPYFIKFLLPNFVDGTMAAQWSLLVGLLSIFNVFSNIYMVVQKNMYRLTSYLTGFSIWLICLFTLYTFRGFSLQMFPQSMCMAYIGIYSMDIYFFRKFAAMYKGE